MGRARPLFPDLDVAAPRKHICIMIDLADTGIAARRVDSRDHPFVLPKLEFVMFDHFVLSREGVGRTSGS
jgi:hypothetical protein